ncbi:MAG: ATP synthase F1 subunit delta [Tenericutes bacterium HGW-Tenericutes-1]|jgi:F-type H+-transporting ATPase subunit delta|nr:MAG: ATP synthase F1 subunit delta [Tenericutes bacterium HGW-Tenericutes-1]
MTDIANQYALAVYNYACELNKLTETVETIKAFHESLDMQSMKFFSHPKITKSEKKSVIDKTVEFSLVKHFLYVIIDNDRMNDLSDIYQALIERINEKNQILNVNVFTKEILSLQEKETLIKRLENKTKRQINIISIIDPTIISGFRLEYDGFVYDETINNKLSELTNTLLRN